LMPGGAPAGVPLEIATQTDYDLETHDGVVKQGDVRIGKAAAQLTGRFSTKGETPSLQLKLTGKQMPAPDLQAMLPAVGAPLPQGAHLRSGTMDVNLTIAGRIDRLVISGPVNMSDARLAGFDLGSSMRGIGPLAGVSSTSDTVIQTLAATMAVSPDGIRADMLTLIVPAIGNLTGDGTIAPSGALSFNMLAKLANAGGVTGGVARMASFGHPENGVPFKIVGTTAKPLFVPDVGRAVTGLATNPKAASDAVGFAKSIFGKKKN